MKRSLAALAGLAALLAAAACSRQKLEGARPLPAGDGIWFEEGIGPADSGVEENLQRAGLGAVFLPAARLTREGGHWVAQELPPPPRAMARTKVFLVLAGDDSVAQALSRRETATPVGDAAWASVQSLLRDTRPYGPVAGIHLDFPFAAGAADQYGAVVSALRAKMPAGMPVSVSLRFAPEPENAEKMRALAAACDGFVAFVFGEGNRADPIAADGLERPWFAGYAPSARGTWKAASGETRGAVPEWVLSRLSDEPKADFVENVSLQEEGGQAYEIRPRARIALDPGFALVPGDTLSFRQPLASDLFDRLSSDLAGRRFARGRVLALPGRSESERLLTLAGLTEALQGKPANPDLHVATEIGRNFVAVSAENLSAHPSVISRTSNWVEVRLPSAGIRDVQTGGFDRFEVYGTDRRPITLGLATIVRFYETLIQPHEQIKPARILLHRAPHKDCCPIRFHLLAASGQEKLSDATPQ